MAIKEDDNLQKTDRLLILLYRLMTGERVKKHLFIEEYSIGKRTFDRYIETLRMVLSDIFSPYSLTYDVNDNSYYLTGLTITRLQGMELLPILHLVFGSRALVKEDIADIIYPLLSLLPVRYKKEFSNLVIDLGRSYDLLENSVPIIKMLWDLHRSILRKQKIILRYQNEQKTISEIPVFPMRLTYQGGQFWLTTAENNQKNTLLAVSEILSFTVAD